VRGSGVRQRECGRCEQPQAPSPQPRAPTHLYVSIGHVVAVQPRDGCHQLAHEKHRHGFGQALRVLWGRKERPQRAAAGPLGDEAEGGGQELDAVGPHQPDVRAGGGRQGCVGAGLRGRGRGRGPGIMVAGITCVCRRTQAAAAPRAAAALARSLACLLERPLPARVPAPLPSSPRALASPGAIGGRPAARP
jgi:hypothetical protein